MKRLACTLIGHRITGTAVIRGRFVSYCSRCDRNL